jgi:hypothetical protein
LTTLRQGGFCTACFGGGYPTETPTAPARSRFEYRISERKEMAMSSRSESYARRGRGHYRRLPGVELMKSHVARTLTPGVIGDMGGFGGLFAPELTAWPSRCWSPAPTAWAPS